MAGIGVAKEQFDAARGGKRLLTEGGPRGELGILAKMLAVDSAMADADLVHRIASVIDLYEEAEVGLQRQVPTAEAEAVRDIVEAVTDPGAGPLGESYRTRAGLFKYALTMLADGPGPPILEGPTVTATEAEAIGLVRLRLTQARFGLRGQVGAVGAAAAAEGVMTDGPELESLLPKAGTGAAAPATTNTMSGERLSAAVIQEAPVPAMFASSELPMAAGQTTADVHAHTASLPPASAGRPDHECEDGDRPRCGSNPNGAAGPDAAVAGCPPPIAAAARRW